MSNNISSMILKDVKVSVFDLSNDEPVIVKKFPDNTLNRFFSYRFREIINWYHMYFDTKENILEIEFKVNNQITFNLSTWIDFGTEHIDLGVEEKRYCNLNIVEEDYKKGYIPMIQNIFKKFWANAIHGHCNQFVFLKLLDFLNESEKNTLDDIYKITKDLQYDFFEKIFKQKPGSLGYREDIGNFIAYMQENGCDISIDKNYESNKINYNNLEYVDEFFKRSDVDQIIKRGNVAAIANNATIPFVIIFSNEKKPTKTKWSIDIEVSERYYFDLKHKIDSLNAINEAEYCSVSTKRPISSESNMIKVHIELEYLGYGDIPVNILNHLGILRLRIRQEKNFSNYYKGYNKITHINYEIRGALEIYLNKDNFDPDKNI